MFAPYKYTLRYTKVPRTLRNSHNDFPDSEILKSLPCGQLHTEL